MTFVLVGKGLVLEGLPSKIEVIWVLGIYMDVSKNRGTPKWMVKIMENPINKWMIWGYPYFWKHPYMYGKMYCIVYVVYNMLYTTLYHVV